MAIVTMKQLRLVAMARDREDILWQLQQAGCVEVREPEGDWTDPLMRNLGRPEGAPLARCREEQQLLSQSMEVLKKYAPPKGGLLAPKPEVSAGALMDDSAYQQALDSAREINRLHHEWNTLGSEIAKLQAQRQLLAPWLTLDVPLNIPSTRLVVYQFGLLPPGVPLEEAHAQMGELAQLIPAGADRSGQYALLVCHRQVQDQALNALKELGWSKTAFRDLEGTALDVDRRTAGEIERLTGERTDRESRLAALGDRWPQLHRAADRALVDLRREESKTHLLDTRSTFLLEGWVPAERWDDLVRGLDPWPCALWGEDPQPEQYDQVPVKLKNNWFTRPLNMVTEMYSLPAYGTLDPNPLMAPFFILFYGIMMADMGYGLLMMLASLIVLKKKRPTGGMAHFFGLLGLCGVSTFAMGAVTGGFFGDFLTQLFKLLGISDDFALPALFNPLDDTMMILVGAMALGGVQIITGMAISFVVKVRKGDYLDALFEEVTWWLVFAGLALAVLGVTSAVLIAAGALVVAGPLVTGTGMGKITGIFGSLYNHVTGFFGDILSYSRLMALMLAGSVIAQVFNTLGAIPGNVVIFLLISAVGNTLNFALNLLGCYVHDLRLQCLEYFGKFYQDGGKPFRPLDLKTTYYNITE